MMLRSTLRGSRIVAAWSGIAGGTTVEKTVDIGGSSLLRLRVADGKPLEVRAWRLSAAKAANGPNGPGSRGVLEQRSPGVHDVEIDPEQGIENKWLRGVGIAGGTRSRSSTSAG